MTVVSVEPSTSPGVLDLVRQGDEFGLSLYPPESYYALDAAELDRDDVELHVARHEGAAIGIAALVDAGDGTGELKRMFVDPAARGRGAARALLTAVEDAARRRGIHTLRLETGPKQPEAIGLYTSHGYDPIDAFGPYVGDPSSLCFAKSLA